MIEMESLMQEMERVPDEAIISKLTSHISAVLPRGSVLASNPPVKMLRSYSFFMRYSWYPNGDTAYPMNLLVKIPRKPGMTELHPAICDDSLKADALREYNVLRSLNDAIKELDHPNLYAIEAFAYIEEVNAILMQELDLRLLDTFFKDKKILIGSSEHWSQFENYVRLAGELLRHFHEKVGDERPAPLSGLGAGSLIEREFSRLEAILGYPPRHLRDGFDRLYRELERVETPAATLHKDYHLGNIFLTRDGRVGMLDPNCQARGSVYEDIARLVVDPLTRKTQIVSLGLYFRPTLARRFEQAVLRGYFGAGPVDENLLRFYCALWSLTMWRVYEENMTKRRSSGSSVSQKLIRQVFRFYFPNLVKSFLDRGIRYTMATAP